MLTGLIEVLSTCFCQPKSKYFGKKYLINNDKNKYSIFLHDFNWEVK